jgi:lysozyme
MGFISNMVSALNADKTPSDEWVLGTDTSHWSGTINFDKMYQAGARFWITKASDSYLYQGKSVLFEDSEFDNYCKQAYNNKRLLTGCYHWLQPHTDPIVAADFYLQRYARYDFDFPPVLDFEEPSVLRTGKFSDYSWRAEEWLRHVENKTGRKPIIYTANWFMSQLPQKYVSWMSAYPSWVAFYNSWWGEVVKQMPSTALPYPWQDWTMWQFSADGNRRGAEFGVQAGDIDLNWFQGNYFDLLEFLQKEDPVQPPPVTPEPDYLFKAKCIVDGLNVRKGPSISYSKRRVIRRGDIVNVYAVQNNWYKISSDLEEWVSGYPQYMEKIGDEGDVLFQAKCVATALNVRYGPSTAYAKHTDYLENGDIVNVYNVKNNWFKISDTEEKWVSGYSQYMQKI